MQFPDPDQHLKGFNPLIYPDFCFTYTVAVQAKGEEILISARLDREIPSEYEGKLCFNFELFPGDLFGKPWIMDEATGIFPMQPNGPLESMPGNRAHILKPLDDRSHADAGRLMGNTEEYNPMTADELIAAPYAIGKRLTIRPDDPYHCFTIESLGKELKLYDGRMNHNNGWFVVSCELPVLQKGLVAEFVLRPSVVEDWKYEPVVQTSQVGYHPLAKKVAMIEFLQENFTKEERELPIQLIRFGEHGAELVMEEAGKYWGKFLRYQYLQFDFSAVREEGLYQVRFGKSCSSVFRIAQDIYERGVWQPVLEYFLPVQMCHMRVNEKYRVWHDLCHEDDAEMAPLNYNHFDGYEQGASTLTKYKPGEHVNGLNRGGWHDAGDFDLRIESQAGECYNLTLAYEAFNVYLDVTSIDQEKKVTEIHQPDGKNDILQQIEHGMLSIVLGYQALGRLYRGIICRDLRQYVLLGDPSAMTRNVVGDGDDRWVFTEDNPQRELQTAAALAASSRALKGFHEELSTDALQIAIELYTTTKVLPEEEKVRAAKISAAVELLITTGEEVYRTDLLSETELIIKQIRELGWLICRVLPYIADADFTQKVRCALQGLQKEYEAESQKTPYGIPYRPHIWGAGWGIQRLGMEYYYLHEAFPDIFGTQLIYDSLNFVLGCHPGKNTASFASGVGAKSVTAAYCMNRADWSYIPGGVVSGTALIRPDFAELLEFPFLWQQTEYVLGGGSSNYLFLVLAVKKLLKEQDNSVLLETPVKIR